MMDTTKAQRIKSFGAYKILNTATTTWFLVSVVGLWIFSYYVATFYVGSAIKGDFEQWNTVLPKGHIPGDNIGNLAVAMHLFLAIIVIVGGPLQIAPQVRKFIPKFHRWSGRVYLLTVFIVSGTGLYMNMTRGNVGGPILHLGTNINAILIMCCAILTLHYALRGQFDAHRRWALRLFLTANGVWFFRVGLMFWLFVNGGPVGFDPKTFQGPFLNILVFAQYLLPLTVLEFYLQVQDRKSTRGQWFAAVLIFALTTIMAIGIFAATMGLWLPRLR